MEYGGEEAVGLDWKVKEEGCRKEEWAGEQRWMLQVVWKFEFFFALSFSTGILMLGLVLNFFFRWFCLVF